MFNIKYSNRNPDHNNNKQLYIISGPISRAPMSVCLVVFFGLVNEQRQIWKGCSYLNGAVSIGGRQVPHCHSRLRHVRPGRHVPFCVHTLHTHPGARTEHNAEQWSAQAATSSLVVVVLAQWTERPEQCLVGREHARKCGWDDDSIWAIYLGWGGAKPQTQHKRKNHSKYG